MLSKKHTFFFGDEWYSLRSLSRKIIPALLMLYLVFILPVQLPNAGGSGLRLPQNLLAWSVMTLCIAGAILRAILTGKIIISRFMFVVLAGISLLALPWMWTPNQAWQNNALPRLEGLVGALFFLLALCQRKMSPRVKSFLLYSIVLAALGQAITAMAEAWFPDLILQLTGSRPHGVVGVFQQRNLLGSWLATGIGISLYQAFTARTRLWALAWVGMLFPLVTALVLSQSRTGLLGAMIMMLTTACVDYPRWRKRPLAVLRRVVLLTSVLIWGYGISIWAMPSGTPADFVHEASTQQRMRVIYGTLTLIARHPLVGNGLGSFESLFPQALADSGLKSVENQTFTHPHNEVLYVLAEGGITALIGLLILGGVWIWPALHHVRRGFNLAREGLLLSLAGLPIVIHMMTEYPLYLSAPHLMVLLILFRSALPETTLHFRRVSLVMRILVLPALSAGCFLVIVLLASGLHVQSELTYAEDEINAGLIPVLPMPGWRSFTQVDRLNYDRYMLAVSRPGFWRNKIAMDSFTHWGVMELTVHNDAEIAAALMAIADYRGDRCAKNELAERAARVFVADSRFKLNYIH